MRDDKVLMQIVETNSNNNSGEQVVGKNQFKLNPRSACTAARAESKIIENYHDNLWRVTAERGSTKASEDEKRRQKINDESFFRDGEEVNGAEKLNGNPTKHPCWEGFNLHKVKQSQGNPSKHH
jgi:hypothetical protein